MSFTPTTNLPGTVQLYRAFFGAYFVRLYLTLTLDSDYGLHKLTGTPSNKIVLRGVRQRCFPRKIIRTMASSQPVFRKPMAIRE